MFISEFSERIKLTIKLKRYAQQMPLFYLLIPFLFFSALAQKIKPKDYDALSAEAAANSVNDELVEFLSIPNNALIEGHAENNRKWLKSAF